MLRMVIEGKGVISKQATIRQLHKSINDIQNNDSQGVVIISFNPADGPIGSTFCFQMPGYVIVESILDLAEHHNVLPLVLRGVIKRLLNDSMKGGDAPNIF